MGATQDWKKQSRRNFKLLVKAGLPYTVFGMIVIFLGIYLLKHFFNDSEYLSVLLIGWLAVFWFIYQPLFIKKIRNEDTKIKNN